MKIRLTISSRSKGVYAEAIYDGNTVTVLPGGTISKDFAEHIQGGKKARSFRDNPEYVDKNRRIIKECIFTSPSTAAQFVTGRSTNGYVAWKVDDKESLGKYLKKNGLR